LVDGTDLYRYAEANPIRFSDPTGLWPPDTEQRDPEEILSQPDLSIYNPPAELVYSINHPEDQEALFWGQDVAASRQERLLNDPDVQDALEQAHGNLNIEPDLDVPPITEYVFPCEVITGYRQRNPYLYTTDRERRELRTEGRVAGVLSGILEIPGLIATAGQYSITENVAETYGNILGDLGPFETEEEDVEEEITQISTATSIVTGLAATSLSRVVQMAARREALLLPEFRETWFRPNYGDDIDDLLRLGQELYDYSQTHETVNSIVEMQNATVLGRIEGQAQTIAGQAASSELGQIVIEEFNNMVNDAPGGSIEDLAKMGLNIFRRLWRR
jgi:hypothetical protein